MLRRTPLWLLGPFHEIAIVSPEDVTPEDTLLDSEHAALLLKDEKPGQFGWVEFAHHLDLPGGGNPKKRVLRALRAGWVVAVQVNAGALASLAPTAPVASVEALGPAPGAEEDRSHWIEIEVVDELGRPVPNVEYRIECAGGEVRTGTSGADGRAKEWALVAGVCKFGFPALDGPAWNRA